MVGRVGVVVLGDLGRSPRMRYHALSLASSGFQVSFTVFFSFLFIRDPKSGADSVGFRLFLTAPKIIFWRILNPT